MAHSSEPLRPSLSQGLLKLSLDGGAIAGLTKIFFWFFFSVGVIDDRGISRSGRI